MNKSSKKFLHDLLETPSPSGQEWDIQKIWMRYVKKFADEVTSDIVGNVFAVVNPKAKFKIMLTGHCDEIGFMINRIDSHGFLYFTKVGGISPKIAPGMKIQVLGSGKTLTGVVGVNAEHHGGLKDSFSFEDLYIDCGAKNKKEIEKYVSIGDFAVYKRKPEYLLNNRLTSKGLDDKTGAFIVAEVLRNVAKKSPKVAVYAVSTVSEEIGLHGAYFAGANVQPDIAIACDVTFATDYPNVKVNKYGSYALDKGPVLAKGSPINPKINALLADAAKELKIPIQYELTPSSTGTDADRMRFTGKGIPVALVSLPLRYMHAPVETISIKDLENEIKLLTQMILNLTGHENLKPLE